MRIQYLPANGHGGRNSMYLTTYLVNDSLAIDAGVLGSWGSVADQSAITDIVLTHSHLDHVGSLPMFVDNVYRPGKPPVRVHLSDATRKALEERVFTGETWTEIRWLQALDPPMVEFHALEAGQTTTLADLQLTTVAVNHPVPTFGVIIQDETGSVAISSDTGPTDEFWEACRNAPKLQAIFLECSFPNELESLAVMAGHLTPNLFQAERLKLGRTVRTIAMHLKPAHADQVVEELASFDDPSIEVVAPGHVYQFTGA